MSELRCELVGDSGCIGGCLPCLPIAEERGIEGGEHRDVHV